MKNPVMPFVCCIFTFHKSEEVMKAGSILTWWSALGIFAVLEGGNFVLACLWLFGVLAVGKWLGWVAFKVFPVGEYEVFLLLHPPFIGIFPRERLAPRVLHFFGEENQVLIAFDCLPIHTLKSRS